MKSLKLFVSLIILVLFDQYTKFLVLKHIKPIHSFPLIEKVLSFTYLENRGAVWGIMQGKIPILAIFTVIIFIFVLYMYYRIPQSNKFRLLRFISILIMAGAIGNFIDRIFRGFVVDFIYFELIDFPIFNVADIYVVVASALLIISMLFIYKDDSDFDFLNCKKEETND